MLIQQQQQQGAQLQQQGAHLQQQEVQLQQHEQRLHLLEPVVRLTARPLLVSFLGKLSSRLKEGPTAAKLPIGMGLMERIVSVASCVEVEIMCTGN